MYFSTLQEQKFNHLEEREIFFFKVREKLREKTLKMLGFFK